MHQIRAESIVPASPEQVWAVLADFARYGEWNPLNLEVDGEAKVGTRARMVFRNLAGQGVIR